MRTALIAGLLLIAIASPWGTNGAQAQNLHSYLPEPQTEAEVKAFDAELSQFAYPYPVRYFRTTRQNQALSMAYMDVMPENRQPKGTVVLMHGKNFSGFYFAPIIAALRAQNYRVIVPDQVGFGKSTKPEHFQFSFHALAELTHALLARQGIAQFQLMGHSMGGMLATRYALMYPEDVSSLILVNPIGLEDYKVLTSYRTLDALYDTERNKSAEDIRNYQKQSYYDGQWKPAYEAMIQPALGWLKGPDYDRIAYNAAQTTEMLYTQPVVYEFKHLTMPVTFILGQRDKTAPGRAWAPEANKPLMGNYPLLGPKVVAMIPQGKLIKMPGLGHMPFVEDFEGFMPLFLKALSDK